MRADRRVRSTSLGLRISDASWPPPSAETKEHVTIVAALADGRLEGRGLLALQALAAPLGAVVTRWWLIGRRSRDHEDTDNEAHFLTGP